MGYLNNLAHVDGKRGIFTIVLTATILTIFEIVFFYMVVAPGVNTSMNRQLDNIGKNLVEGTNEKALKLQKKYPIADAIIPEVNETVFNESIRGIFATFAEREKLLTDKINWYTKVTGVLIILILMTVLYLLYSSIKSEVGNGDIGLKDPTYTALFTVLMLIAFQILFFNFSQVYKFPGTFGTEELQNVMIGAIKT